MSHSVTFLKRHPAILPVLLGAAILVVSAVVLVFAIGSRDSLPPADADLAFERPDVPDDANAYIAFLAAAEAYVPPTHSDLFSDYLSGKTRRHQRAQGLHRQQRRILRAASTRDGARLLHRSLCRH